MINCFYSILFYSIILYYIILYYYKYYISSGGLRAQADLMWNYSGTALLAHSQPGAWHPRGASQGVACKFTGFQTGSGQTSSLSTQQFPKSKNSCNIRGAPGARRGRPRGIAGSAGVLSGAFGGSYPGPGGRYIHRVTRLLPGSRSRDSRSGTS